MTRDRSLIISRRAVRPRARFWPLLASVLASAGALAAVLPSGGALASQRVVRRVPSHQRAGAAHAAGPIGFSREIYGFTSRLPLVQEATRYSVMVLQTTDGRWVARLHRVNPHLRIFVYENVLRTRPGALQECTTLAEDRAHPGWLLRSPTGGALTSGALTLTDAGNVGYQSACVSRAIAVARRWHFDGVFFDGVVARMAFEFPDHRVPPVAGYPNDRAWQAAQISLLRYATAAMHAHGLLLIGNVGGADRSLWRRCNSVMDGAEEEAFTDIGFGVRQFLWWWPIQLDNIAWSVAHGKLLILHSHNLTAAGNRFALATALLAASPAVNLSTANGNYHGYEAWYPDYSRARGLGAPLGRYVRRGSVRLRWFHNGVVLVNPTPRASRLIRLGGRYSGDGERRVRALRVPALAGLILLRVS